jgi:hypothetical protein
MTNEKTNMTMKNKNTLEERRFSWDKNKHRSSTDNCTGKKEEEKKEEK